MLGQPELCSETKEGGGGGRKGRGGERGGGEENTKILVLPVAAHSEGVI